MKKVINGTYKIDCMSDSFFGKFDLYDFLVVLVPGCAIEDANYLEALHD